MGMDFCIFDKCGEEIWYCGNSLFANHKMTSSQIQDGKFMLCYHGAPSGFSNIIENGVTYYGKEAAEKIRAAKPFIDPEKYSEIERTIKNYPNFHFYAWW